MNRNDGEEEKFDTECEKLSIMPGDRIQLKFSTVAVGNVRKTDCMTH